jgi:membrane-bound metal-dependent hydrolase YbcI (DUF457 family)
MLAGHFAAAAAMKAKEPRVPTWALVVGVQVLDILFMVFVGLGIERMTKTPGEAAGIRLDFIDWSHSLAMALVWTALYAALFFRRGRVVVVWCAIAVFSHFVLDFFMHPPDLALWPHSAAQVGLGLWTHRPLWWFVELGFIAACLLYYVARRGRSAGRWAWVGLGTIVVLHVLNSPWLQR